MVIPKKLLAIKLRALGDTVLMTAPLMEFRKAYPDCEIHAAVDRRWASVLENHPAVDQIWLYERHQEKAARAKAATRLALRLREQNFDCVVNFHASPSSAMIARATGATVRAVHFHGHKDKNQYSTLMIPGKGVLKPIIERDMDVLRALGLEIPEGRLPQIFLKSSEFYQAEAAIQRDLTLPKPILGIALGASRPTKSWPSDRYAQLAIEWCKKEKGSVFALSGPEETELLEAFIKNIDQQLEIQFTDPAERRSIRNRIVPENQLNVRQLAALLSRFSVLVGNDSGPKHLAVAVDTPTVTVFGPEDPFEWHPYPQDRHPYLFVEDLKCRKDHIPGMRPWCGIPECNQEKHQCMTKILFSDVFKECQRVARRI